MTDTRRRLLKGLAATPVVLATAGMSGAQSKPEKAQDPELAAELRDTLRQRNGRVASFKVTLRDPADAESQGEDAGAFSKTITFFNGHYYLDWMYDYSDVPVLFKLRGPKHVIIGPLKHGRPGKSRILRTKTWPSSPNVDEILPVPKVFPTVIAWQADREGRKVVTLGQGDRVFWVDPKTLDVLQEQKLDSHGELQTTIVFDDFRPVSGHRVPHEINSFVAGRSTPRRVILSDVELWDTPQFHLFDVEPYLLSARPAGDRNG